MKKLQFTCSTGMKVEIPRDKILGCTHISDSEHGTHCVVLLGDDPNEGPTAQQYVTESYSEVVKLLKLADDV